MIGWLNSNTLCVTTWFDNCCVRRELTFHVDMQELTIFLLLRLPHKNPSLKTQFFCPHISHSVSKICHRVYVNSELISRYLSLFHAIGNGETMVCRTHDTTYSLPPCPFQWLHVLVINHWIRHRQPIETFRLLEFWFHQYLNILKMNFPLIETKVSLFEFVFKFKILNF